jgi:hypothetical protein
VSADERVIDLAEDLQARMHKFCPDAEEAMRGFERIELDASA